MAHKIAIIGLGIMGRRLLGRILEHAAFEPVAIWDPSETACKKAAAEAPGVPIVDSAEAAIAAADVVYLACPPVPRKAYALEAAAAGKAVFLEKPLGVDVAESRDLVEKLKASGVPAAVNFTQAAGRALATVQEAMTSGAAGAISNINIIVTYPAWPRAWQVDADWLRFKEEGGYTREVISHFVFLSERILGRTKLVWAKPSYPADPALCETQILARLENDAGVPVSILGSVGGVQPDRQEVYLTFAKTGFLVAEFYRLFQSDGGAWQEILDPPADPRKISLGAQLSALDDLLQGRPSKLATLDDALSVQEKIEGMLAGT
ncbi:MAG: Gfo/Idh/MocA family oxidoreductase [Thalassobaculaceae bacterium]